ncbi:MAG: putative secreted protein [Micrococcaceae bacterium]|jgi:hypothetical protein|nr:putative secreted protein [Micrococcaceae bacterium]
MKRLFWLGLGVALGAVAVRRISRTGAALGPEGLNRALGRLSDSVVHFAGAVREGMAERETDLRGALGIDAGGERVLADAKTAFRRTRA